MSLNIKCYLMKLGKDKIKSFYHTKTITVENIQNI